MAATVSLSVSGDQAVEVVHGENEVLTISAGQAHEFTLEDDEDLVVRVLPAE